MQLVVEFNKVDANTCFVESVFACGFILFVFRSCLNGADGLQLIINKFDCRRGAKKICSRLETDTRK